MASPRLEGPEQGREAGASPPDEVLGLRRMSPDSAQNRSKDLVVVFGTPELGRELIAVALDSVAPTAAVYFQWFRK